ncbi:hypothetical protein GOEFS_037_00010, partial [Gordonia effusa NBRC 100432]
AAGAVGKTADCATENYSHMTFPGSDSKLCLALNLAQDSCYQINPSNIAVYRRIDCGSTPTDGAVAYKVVSRSDSAASCGAGQLAVNYEQPKVIGYCLEKV